MKLNFKNHNKGFTLVESLVAISILSLSIAAAFTAVQKGIQSSTIARDQVTAFYLVQEAMEFVRNKRDENALRLISGASINWRTGFASLATDPCGFGKTCTVDAPLGTFANCPGGSGTCPVLRQDPVSYLYGYTPAWTPTSFRREIRMSLAAADEVVVTISINWTTGGTPYSFQVTENLMNHT